MPRPPPFLRPSSSTKFSDGQTKSPPRLVQRRESITFRTSGVCWTISLLAPTTPNPLPGHECWTLPIRIADRVMLAEQCHKSTMTEVEVRQNLQNHRGAVMFSQPRCSTHKKKLQLESFSGQTPSAKTKTPSQTTNLWRMWTRRLPANRYPGHHPSKSVVVFASTVDPSIYGPLSHFQVSRKHASKATQAAETMCYRLSRVVGGGPTVWWKGPDKFLCFLGCERRN